MSIPTHILPLWACLDATLPRFKPARLTCPTSVWGNAHLAIWAARLASARLVICQVAFWTSEVKTRWSVLCISKEIVPWRANGASSWWRTHLAPLGTHSTLPSFFIIGLRIWADYFTLSATRRLNRLLLTLSCSFVKCETWFASRTIWSLLAACRTRTIALLALAIDCSEITLTAYQFWADSFAHPVIWKAFGARLWTCALLTCRGAVLALPIGLPGACWALRNTFHAYWVSVAPLVLSLLAGLFPALWWAVWIACDASLILPICESPHRACRHTYDGAILALKSKVPWLALTASLYGRAWWAPAITFFAGLTWGVIILTQGAVNIIWVIIIGILIPSRRWTNYLWALDCALPAYFQVILGSNNQIVARGAFQARPSLGIDLETALHHGDRKDSSGFPFWSFLDLIPEGCRHWGGILNLIALGIFRISNQLCGGVSGLICSVAIVGDVLLSYRDTPWLHRWYLKLLAWGL